MADFTARQRKGIELMALGTMTQVAIAQELGVAEATVSKWKRKKKGFMDAVLIRARELLKQNIPEVYKALADKSKEGKDRHIKILLDHLEKLEEVKASRANITFTWQLPTVTTE